MTNLEDLSIFDIDEEKIPEEIFNIADNLSSREKAAYKNKYGSWRNYIIVLYYFRFEKKLMNAQIAQNLGIKSQNVHNNLYKFGWEHFPDFEINNKIASQKKLELDKKIYEAKQKSNTYNFSNNELVNNALKLNIKPYVYLKFGFNSKNDYVKTLYLLRFIEELPPREICKILNESINVTAQRLRTLGFNKSHKQGIEDKKKLKTQDYKKTKLHGNITRLQSQMESGSLGSANENKFRIQLSFRLPELLNSKELDIIVGLPNIGNLGTLETDIPIMIFDNLDQKLFRFVVEWNGKYFHSELRDENKKNVAIQRGWKYIPIYEYSDGKYSNNFEKIDEMAIKVCNVIKDQIN